MVQVSVGGKLGTEELVTDPRLDKNILQDVPLKRGEGRQEAMVVGLCSSNP